MRLRLYHHHDGARVAYREAGAGPVIALLHSAYLSHKEFEPVVEHLADRFRVVLPDLPLHGDSEHRAHHPYTLDWMAEVMSGFSAEALGPRPLIGGHGMGAEILVRAVISGRLRPPRVVLLLWADEDEWHPVDSAEEALDLLPHAELRVLSGAGFLLAHDDPVGLARELAAFSVRGVRPAPGRLS